jgi:two-component system, OmpR family, aerobic respiration control sensor histidine kinase ArcB
MQKPRPANALPDSALPDRFDANRFQRLIELAGPAMAATLMHQLDEDLATARRRLSTALEANDFGGIRQASHDLIALAGSCGAETLHDLARAVNDGAHHRTLAPILAVQPAVDGELEKLLAVIRATLKAGAPTW